MPIVERLERSVQAGTRLGPYEIVSRIGAGGMGEVWRARDTRLGREVAIKVLPEEFAADEKRRMRFEREAKTISQLNHPHICTLHDVGHDGGVTYLVLELIEGETLAARIARGALPIDRVITYGVEMAGALDKAHRAGVVHRDLKPANVMITRSGVKLLDFGLAKQRCGSSPNESTSKLEAPLTGGNEIVGTVQYMSPEQLAGEEPDARSDIFALGAVLYQMATGRYAFERASRTNVVAAIMSEEPTPMTELQPLTPPALEHVVQKCLAKDRDERWQSAADLAEELRWIGIRGTDDRSGAVRQSSNAKRWAVVSTIALLVLIAAAPLVRLRLYPRTTSPSAQVTRFQVSDSSLVGGNYTDSPSFAVSPDGRTLAYVKRSDETSQLYLRPLASLQDLALDGTADATEPFFSPDGKAVGFCADGKLKKIGVDDRHVITLADATGCAGASWAADGTIVFSARDTLFRVSDRGGAPRQLTHLNRTRGEAGHYWPQFVNAEWVLFASDVGYGTDFTRRIEAINLRSGKIHVVLDPARGARATFADKITAFRVATGRFLLFIKGRRLHAIRFDARHAVTEGDPVSTLDLPNLWFEISDNGTLVHFSPASVDEPFHVVRVDAKGNDQTLPIPGGEYIFMTLSPDERQLALTRREEGTSKIVIADLERGGVLPLSKEGTGHIAIWTADSKRVIYGWNAEGPSNLVWRRADGSDDAESLVTSTGHQDPGSMSPDGQWLMYTELDRATGWDIWRVPLSGRRTPQPFLRTPADELSPMISPDGRRLACVISTATGPLQQGYGGRWRLAACRVFIDSFPIPTRRLLVADGRYPLWSHDGKTLYYWRADRVFAVTVSPDGSVGEPRLVTTVSALAAFGYGPPPFAVMKDGSLLVLRRQVTPALTVVMNWGSELQQFMGGAPGR